MSRGFTPRVQTLCQLKPSTHTHINMDATPHTHTHTKNPHTHKLARNHTCNHTCTSTHKHMHVHTHTFFLFLLQISSAGCNSDAQCLCAQFKKCQDYFVFLRKDQIEYLPSCVWSISLVHQCPKDFILIDSYDPRIRPITTQNAGLVPPLHAEVHINTNIYMQKI